VLCALAGAAGALGAAALLAGAGGEPGGAGAQASATDGKGHTEAADRRTDGRSAPAREQTPKTGRTGKGSRSGPPKGAGGSAKDSGKEPGDPAGTGTTTPKAGNGIFHTAQASGKAAGTGTLRRYEVQVEEGTGVAPDEAAREIEAILADRRSWTADGHDAFQLVSQGTVDFVVKIATPATVDRICGAAGLHTHGEVNCDVGAQVLVNLKRWNEGSPQFPGTVHEYRALIVNHEVGHRIGHGHEACPGPGRPAPAMMQQIDGLHGCVANAWPYDAEGDYLGGPAVP
jgi:hypothetical protein